MSNDKPCICPICQSNFTPANGITAEEHIAREIIKVYAELQRKAEQGDYANCARCGVARMLPKVERNALSRQIDGVYVCPVCGMDEAVRDYAECALELDSWWVCKELLKESLNRA